MAFGPSAGGFGFMGIFFILFFLAFFAILGLILYTVFRNISRERKNDKAPRLSVQARVLAKREELRRYGTQHNGIRVHQLYFATFQVPSGDRMELQLENIDYGLIVEGDQGILHFQGTRFLGFDRQ